MVELYLIATEPPFTCIVLDRTPRKFTHPVLSQLLRNCANGFWSSSPRSRFASSSHGGVNANYLFPPLPVVMTDHISGRSLPRGGISHPLRFRPSFLSTAAQAMERVSDVDPYFSLPALPLRRGDVPSPPYFLKPPSPVCVALPFLGHLGRPSGNFSIPVSPPPQVIVTQLPSPPRTRAQRSWPLYTRFSAGLVNGLFWGVSACTCETVSPGRCLRGAPSPIPTISCSDPLLLFPLRIAPLIFEQTVLLTPSGSHSGLPSEFSVFQATWPYTSRGRRHLFFDKTCPSAATATVEFFCLRRNRGRRRSVARSAFSSSVFQ